MERHEWEAWLGNEATQQFKALIQEKADGYKAEKSVIDPRGYDDAHGFYARALVLTAQFESYDAMFKSLDVDAFEDIFEEQE